MNSTPTEPMDFDDLPMKYKKAHVTYGALSKFLDEIIKASGAAVRGLREKTTATDARLALLTGRLDALEAKAAKSVISNVRWAGVYEAGHEYHSGELIQRNGLWLALKTTAAAPGSDPTSWRLVVHRKLVPVDDGR